MCDIGLNNVDTASLEVRSAVQTCEESFPELKGQLVLSEKVE
jgi:hypothetical protein